MSPALVFLLLGSPKTALHDFIAKPDKSYAWRETSPGELRLTSQTWQGEPWKHSIMIARPRHPLSGDTAVLYITGDRVARADDPFVREFADKARMPVAALFDIPNQPRWDAREDALIAYTYGKYVETGDPSWPLLLPMTKAAIRAMDAVQAWSKGKIKRFIVTGASKRGWTTWLVGGAQDKRVIGIAPMVFDMLNMPAQLAHQKEIWGDYSPMIRDYVENGLTQLVATPRGKELLQIVDPYSYLDRITVPKLIVLGANDPYWALDAHSLYLDKVHGKTLMRIVPNAGHDLAGGRDAASSIALFARLVSGASKGGLPVVGEADKRLVGKKTWMAAGPNLDYHTAGWSDHGMGGSTNYAPKFVSFQEFVYRDRDLTASFTTAIPRFRP